MIYFFRFLVKGKRALRNRVEFPVKLAEYLRALPGGLLTMLTELNLRWSLEKNSRGSAVETSDTQMPSVSGCFS